MINVNSVKLSVASYLIYFYPDPPTKIRQNFQKIPTLSPSEIDKRFYLCNKYVSILSSNKYDNFIILNQREYYYHKKSGN